MPYSAGMANSLCSPSTLELSLSTREHNLSTMGQKRSNMYDFPEANPVKRARLSLPMPLKNPQNSVRGQFTPLGIPTLQHSSTDRSIFRSLYLEPEKQTPPTNFLRTARLQPTEHSPTRWLFPTRFKPLPANISLEDAKYLSVKGALAVPPRPLRDALLRAFVEHVHPQMPVIDLPTFISDIDKPRVSGETPGVSLLLFQAVVFSATAFVHIKHLHAAGFATRKEARRLFFHKTRLLYDFDYESDRITLIQTLLLMTLWHETLDDEKGAWHWIGVAISLAETIGMNRMSGLATTPKERLWKRIWWACFVRDQMIALGMRRPSRIGQGNFNTSMLEESDFEIRALRASFATVPEECRLLRDTGMQRQLALVYISQAQLCCSLSKVLETQYSIQPKLGRHDPASSTMMLLPRDAIDNDALCRIDAELQDWRGNLPTCCQYRIPAKTDMKYGRAPVSLQRTLLHMLYNTTMITLHRPTCQSATNMAGDVLERSQARMAGAAMVVSQMASDLNNAGGGRFLPGTGITVLVPAMMVHVVGMRGPVTSETYQSALRAFTYGKIILESLRETYCSADTSIQLLDVALKPPVRPAVEAVSEPEALAESETDQLVPGSTSNPGNKERVQVKPSGSSGDLLSSALADNDHIDAGWSPSAFEEDMIALAAAVGIEVPSLRDAGCLSEAESSTGEPWVRKIDWGVDNCVLGEV